MKIRIHDLMEQSGVKFGTSGARGLAADLTDRVAYTYTRGFLQYLQALGEVPATGGSVAVAGDLRPSTDRIIEAVSRASGDAGQSPENFGKIPSPAVALYGLTHHVPAIMVTGSHIPEDRNGIKFNRCTGEILKEDESAIRQQTVEIDDQLFNADGSFVRSGPTRAVQTEARELYRARYLEGFPADCLRGLKLGLYQHSAVGRELIHKILTGLGATVIPLGMAAHFIPVDTEAIRPADVELAQEWAGEHQLDAIVSTDGDSDRPLISDEHGHWLRGDLAGILCARFLEAKSVSTPVSCNTAIERCGWFPEVRRTKIGSPFVVASMLAASEAGANHVVGYEANGGFLTNSDLSLGGRPLRALPTRDAVILLLSVLLLARREGRTVAELTATLPARFTASDRLKEFATEKSQALLRRFTTGDDRHDRREIETIFGSLCGHAASLDRTDGLRVTFTNGEIVHLRPSGNAPEFRCYTEAGSETRAVELNRRCLELVRACAETT